MTQEEGGPVLNCPACGTRRVGSGRFCAHCGLDYWRVAAGERVQAVQPEKTPRRARWPKFGLGRRRDRTDAPTAAAAPDAGPAAASATPATVRSAPAEQAAAPPQPSTTVVDGVRTIRVRPPRKPNRLRDTAELLLEQARAIPPRARMPAAEAAGVLVVAFLVLVVLHPFDASNAAPQGTGLPTPTPPSKTALINAFFREVRDPQAGFHVTVSGDPVMTSGGKTTRGSLQGDLQFLGDDVSGALQSTPPGSSAAFVGEIRRSGGRTWVRPTDGAWKAQALPADADVLNPFAWIATTDEVSFVRNGTASGEHRSFILRVDKWLNGAQYDALLANLGNVDRQGSMEVAIDERGVPTQATYQYTMSGTGGTGTKVSVTGTLQYTFDAWGQVGPIGPPS